MLVHLFCSERLHRTNCTTPLVETPQGIHLQVIKENRLSIIMKKVHAMGLSCVKIRDVHRNSDSWLRPDGWLGISPKERREDISAESRVGLKHRGSDLRAGHGTKRSSDHACLGGEGWQSMRVENPGSPLQGGLGDKGPAESWRLMVSVVTTRGLRKSSHKYRTKPRNR